MWRLRRLLTTSAAPRRPSEAERVVLRALRGVRDPQAASAPSPDADIVYTGRVRGVRADQGTGEVSVTLPLDDHYRALSREVKAAVQGAGLPWVTSIRVRMEGEKKKEGKEAEEAQKPLQKRTANDLKEASLGRVRRVVAVSSCKGGVGKSTVAVNLAYSLRAEGHRVGLLDADVYGPSLPTMVSPRDTALRQDPVTGLVGAPVYEGVRLMSYGFAGSPGDGRGRRAAVMRGPMVGNVVQQLAMLTDWGELDYLVVDMPPGTGDVQITLSQQLELAAAVIVTTPQRLSRVDVVKGVEMFARLRVPVAAVVENMAHFDCDGCGKRHRPFGPSSVPSLRRHFDFGRAFEVPMLGRLSACGDAGVPAVLDPDAPRSLRELYAGAARHLHAEVERLAAEAKAAGGGPDARLEDGGAAVAVDLGGGGARAFSVPAAELRRACRCALCVDENTGRQLLDPSSVSDLVRAVSVERMGNYAAAVAFDDGHDSAIYPWSQLEEGWGRALR